MKILLSPARRNRERNPFNFLLSEALIAQGCDVRDPGRGDAVFGRWDVVHVHWPQIAANGPLDRALRKTLAFAARLVVHRLRGARIVWTVHNVHGHDQNNVWLEHILLWSVGRLVHGVIFLSPSTRASAYAEIPTLASKPFRIIPHGLYGQRSKITPGQARTAFGVPIDRPVIGFLGDIKRYKGLDLLISAFEQTPAKRVTLFVAGIFLDADYGAIIRARLAELAAQGHSIVFREERLADSAFVDAIRACDVVAMPYRAIWNSGLALLILENRCRILASDAPVFRELQQELGSEWVQIFCKTLTGARLLAALENRPTAPLEGFGADRSWQHIGAETVSFYRQLGAG